MKASELKNSDIAEYLRINEVEETATITLLKSAAISYIKGYTGLTDEQLDTHEDITIALLTLCSDMYDNRQTTVKESNQNKVVSTILGMYSTNYL